MLAGPFDGLKESFNDLLKDFLGDEESREKKMTWTVHGEAPLQVTTQLELSSWGRAALACVTVFAVECRTLLIFWM